MRLEKAVLENDLKGFCAGLRSGEDPNRPNSLGFTPLQLARFLHRKGLLERIDRCQKRKLKLGNLHDQRTCSLALSEFEQAAGITYLSHLEFASYEQLERIHHYLRRIERTFGEENRWLSAFYRPQIESGEMGDLVVRWIDDRLGYGLFAGSVLAPHSYLGEYTGRVRAARFRERRSLEYGFEYPGRDRWGRRYIVDAAEGGNEMRYINHGDEPNCEAVAVYCEGVVRIAIRALRRIERGEQLTLDYGERYWRHRRGEKITV